MDRGQAVHEFAISEWTKTREQVHLVLQAIWRLESAALIGLSGFYAWFLATSGKRASGILYILGGQSAPPPESERLALAWLATAFSFLILHRLKIEYGILYRLGSYTRSIEGSIYRNEPFGHVHGWESYIRKKPPDKFTWKKFRKFYKNTMLAFTSLLFLSLMFSLYRTHHYLQKMGYYSRIWEMWPSN